VLFVHGGAFVDGDRNRSPEVYANVLYYFARHGCVGVNMEYRLAPAHAYPSGTEDVAGAVAWVQQHIQEYGGDSGQIYLMGHSAGAAHAASYAYDKRHQPAQGPGLAGLIVISGRVRAENIAENPNARKVEAYYGADASIYDDVSPVTHVGADSVPTMVAFAEYENPLIDLYCLELANRLAAARRHAPRLAYMRGHTHTSIIAHFNSAEDLLGIEILAFMRDCKRGTARQNAL
jgi:acetyl esterase/lipase